LFPDPQFAQFAEGFRTCHPIALLCSGCVDFPAEPEQYGLTEEVLKETFSQSVEDWELCWSLKKIPTVGFYRELHNFFKVAFITFCNKDSNWKVLHPD